MAKRLVVAVYISATTNQSRQPMQTSSLHHLPIMTNPSRPRLLPCIHLPRSNRNMLTHGFLILHPTPSHTTNRIHLRRSRRPPVALTLPTCRSRSERGRSFHSLPL